MLQSKNTKTPLYLLTQDILTICSDTWAADILQHHIMSLAMMQQLINCKTVTITSIINQ